MRRWGLFRSHETLAYGLITVLAAGSWAADWEGSLAHLIYERGASSSEQAVKEMVATCAQQMGEVPGVVGVSVAGEKHAASGLDGTIFVPEEFTTALPRAEALVLIKMEVSNVRHQLASREYAVQVACLTAGWLAVSRSSRPPGTLLATLPLVGALLAQRLVNVSNYHRALLDLEPAERILLRSVLEREREDNLANRRLGVSSSTGNDWFDVSRPLLSTRLKMLQD